MTSPRTVPHTPVSLLQRPNWQSITRFVWAIFLVTQPVTSFPYFPAGLGGSTLVRPLSTYPLLILLAIAIVPRLRRTALPRTLLPLIAFGLVALAGSLLAFERGLDPAIGISLADRTVRTLVTLALGMAFFLAVALYPQTVEDLRFTLRWLYYGFFVAFFWSIFQIVYVIDFDRPYFRLLKKYQRYISIRRLQPSRISGMTYEPNWFAEQIAFLLIPWLFASVISGFSVFRWRWKWLTVEALLLGMASIMLIFTYSRAGLALFVLQLVLVLLFRPGGRRASREKSSDPRQRSANSPWKALAKRALQTGLAVALLGALLFAAGSRNNYFARLWSYFTNENASGKYLQYIAFSQRFTYWETAYSIYEDYPLLGIGLGNYTFYFADYLPDRPLQPTPELLYKLTPVEGRNQVVTVKSLLPRLLAETGLLGFATFLAFVIAILGCVLWLLLDPDPARQFWGRAGLLGWIAFWGFSFSFDSFSLPNLWVVFGLISAAASVYGKVAAVNGQVSAAGSGERSNQSANAPSAV
jgi:O-antigen ligase